MTTRLPNVCRSCKHLTRFTPGKGSCEAYPFGIPVEIFSGIDAHAELRGDEEVDLVFEMADREGAQEMFDQYNRTQTQGAISE